MSELLSRIDKIIDQRHRFEGKISEAAQLIDGGKYDEFKKIDFSDAEIPSELYFDIMKEVKTLSGAEYMVETGLVSQEYFKRGYAIFEASSEQIDFYIKSGADVNAIKETDHWFHDTHCERSYLDHILLFDNYSPKNVESVIKAGGMPTLGYFDPKHFVRDLVFVPCEEKEVYHPEDVLFREVRSRPHFHHMDQKNLEDKIRVLNKYGLLSEFDKKYLRRLPFSPSLMAELRADGQTLDPLFIKQKKLEIETKHERLGKTGDSITGEIDKDHHNVAKKQVDVAKRLIQIKRYKEGKQWRK